MHMTTIYSSSHVFLYTSEESKWMYWRRSLWKENMWFYFGQSFNVVKSGVKSKKRLIVDKIRIINRNESLREKVEVILFRDNLFDDAKNRDSVFGKFIDDNNNRAEIVEKHRINAHVYHTPAERVTKNTKIEIKESNKTDKDKIIAHRRVRPCVCARETQNRMHVERKNVC